MESAIEIEDMWSGFTERIQEICDHFHLQKKQLATQIGLHPSDLSKAGAKHGVAYRVLLQYNEINARWLLFGQGEMIDKVSVGSANTVSGVVGDGATSTIHDDRTMDVLGMLGRQLAVKDEQINQLLEIINTMQKRNGY